MEQEWYEALLAADESFLPAVIQKYALDLTALQTLKARSAGFYYDRPAEAVRIAQAAFALGQHLPPPGPALGRWILANALMFTDHYQQAASLFEQARADYLALGLPLEAARLGVGQIWALAYLGNFEQALNLALEIEPLLAASDDPADRKRLGGVYNNLGILYDILGQYEQALSAYDRKLALLEPDSAPLEIARVQHNRGCVLTCLNAFDEAWAAFQAAETGLSTAGATADLARLAFNRALLLAVWQRYPEAEEALQQAETLLAGLAGMEQQRNALVVYRALARLRSGAPLGAELYSALQTAQELLQGPVFEKGLAWLALGYGAMEQDNRDAAHQAFVRSLQLASAGAGQPLSYLAEEGLARLAQAQGQWEAAVAHYEQALQYIETLRRDLQIATFRAGFLTDKLHLYQSLIALYLQLGRPEAAFAVLERAKSRVLVEQLVGRLRQDLAGLEQAEDVETVTLAQTLQRVLQELETRYRQTIQEDFAERGEHWLPQASPALLAEIGRLETQARHLTQQLQRLRPRFSPWAAGYVAAMSEVQSNLAPDVMLLQYAVVHGDVWVFVVDHRGLQTQRCLGSLAEIEATRRRWTAAIERVLGLAGQYESALLVRYLPALVADAEAQLAALYDLLWRPVADESGSARLVLVSPDNVLHYIPFHALLDTRAAPAAYVIERHEIVYAPSATALTLCRRRAGAGTGILLAGYEGAHLAHISAEMAQLTELFPNAQALSGAQATAGRVLETAPARRLIHLASHARFRADNVLLSGFTLADRRLTLAELAQLRLEAELVTLSGCETGRGRLHGADFIGLAGGLLAAGARSLVVSLWRVEDSVTARLMRAFYQHLRAGRTRAAALQAAQLELLEAGRARPDIYGLYRHPACWAPFVLIGDWDALEI